MFKPSAVTYKSRFLKADRRLVTETAGCHTYRTVFGQQACFDDLYLRPGASLQPDTADWEGQLLVLPVVGGALLLTTQEPERALLPGYLYTIPPAEARSFTLTNPFGEETVNVLLLQVTLPAANSATVQEYALPLTSRNVQVSVDNPALSVRVGLYDSRVKDCCRLSPTAQAGDYVLCYVLNGSFEVEDRLAGHRDALLLWDTTTIDFEALAETSILLYMEFKPRPGVPATV